MTFLRNWYRSLSTGLVEVLLPACCPGCHRRLPPRTPICATCLREMETPAPELLMDHLRHLPEPVPVEGAFALGTFQKGGRLQRIHRALKYGNQPYLGHVLGRLMAQGIEQHWPGRAFSAVVPVPLHPRRYLERGYNQSVWLAEGLAEYLHIPCIPEALIRRKATRTQTRLSRMERWYNVSEAFALHPRASVPGTDVLLVDDVLTTGATAGAAARVLHAAGIPRIYLATLAYAAF